MATTKKAGVSKINTTGGRNEVTKKKIHKHLVDINDVITEQDIRNVNPVESIKYGDLNKKEKQKVNREINKVTNAVKKKHKDDKSDGNNTPDIETSWNVLG